MRKIYRAVLFVIVAGLTACNSGSQQGQPASGNSSGSLQMSETVSSIDSAAAVASATRMLNENEVDSLWQLQQKIMQQPSDIALRRELGRRAIDAAAGIIWAVGQGRINPKTTTPNVALNQAKMAATLDASRWAAYLLEWQKTDYAADFGKIETRVPGIKVVRESTNDSLFIVLAQAQIR